MTRLHQSRPNNCNEGYHVHDAQFHHTELLDALEAVVPGIRETMDMFTGRTPLYYHDVKKKLDRGIKDRPQQLEDEMQTVFIAYANIDQKRRRSLSPMSRSSKAMLRSCSLLTVQSPEK
ncbi:hypothetical protein N7451_006675 [Penicillium sp. IBT 35674x]|nr:hypothetical protein N7451_006675 [Penicillium sp. IBT 35674x]